MGIINSVEEDYTESDFIEDSQDDTQPKTFNCIAFDDDILQMYLKDVGRTKMLSRKEEIRFIFVWGC